jgi:hypothetical protein
MKEKDIIEKLADIMRGEIDAFSSNIMFKLGNQYQLFEQYMVEQTTDKRYSVTKTRQDSRLFYRMQSAVAWCIADKFKQYETSRLITDLDRRSRSIKNDVDLTRLMMNRVQDLEKKSIIAAKLVSKQDTLKSLENQLTKCINQAKYWQIKGFIRDETARPRNSKNTGQS